MAKTKQMKTPTICILGLGYVGLPLAVEFSKKYKVIGFDIDHKRVHELNQFIDLLRALLLSN